MPKLNFGNAANGAATGIGFGSAFGPIGMGIGGLLGGISGLLGFGKSTKDKIKKYSALSPQQQQLLEPLYEQLPEVNQQGLSALMQLLNYQPESLEDMQAPALEQFQQEILPNILERFSGMGAKNSSALNQTLGQAAKGLTTNLAAMRANALQNSSQIRQNALSQLLSFNQLGANPGLNQNYIKQGKLGLFDQLSPIAGQLAGNYLGSLGGF